MLRRMARVSVLVVLMLVLAAVVSQMAGGCPGPHTLPCG